MNAQIIDLDDPLWRQTLAKLRHDVYHLPAYIAAEAQRTQTTAAAAVITDDNRVLFLPYLLRSCSDDIPASSDFDAVSPYGYPGILLSQAAIETPEFARLAMQQLPNLLKTQGICSAFVRMHPILSQNFTTIFPADTFTHNGETISVDLTLSQAEIWAHTRKGHQSTINKCKRLGFTARMVPCAEYMSSLKAIYVETMNRVSAKQLYYFDDEYFDNLLALGDRIHLCFVEKDTEIAAACLFFECCGIVQAHLGGTRDAFIEQSPFNLLLDYVRYWAKARGNEFLHLGGGVGGSVDSLYKFKSGFSRQKHEFLTLRLITDTEKYHNLVKLRAQLLNVQPEELLQKGFFPAYRSS